MVNKKVSGGSSKIGRNTDKCKKYRSECRREVNKRRIAKKVAHEAEKKRAKLARRTEDSRIAAALEVAMSM